MLKITIKQKGINIDLSKAIKKSLNQSVELVRWKAVKNAPYQTWNLRRSLTTEVKKDEWIVWSNLIYARVREYVNKKNPSRKFYMKRALESSVWQIKDYFNKNIQNVYNSK